MPLKKDQIEQFYQARNILGEIYEPHLNQRYSEVPTFMRVPTESSKRQVRPVE